MLQKIVTNSTCFVTKRQKKQASGNIGITNVFIFGHKHSKWSTRESVKKYKSARGNYGLVKSWRPYQLNTYSLLGRLWGREQEVKVSDSNRRVLPVFFKEAWRGVQILLAAFCWGQRGVHYSPPG